MKREENFPFSEEELKAAAGQVTEALLGALPGEDQPPHVFSPEFEEKMAALLEREARRRTRRHWLRGVAAGFAAALLLGGVWFATDADAQAGFRRWFRSGGERESVYQNYSPEEAGELPAYEPAWVPEGYVLRYVTRGEDTVDLLYVSQINGAILHLGYSFNAEITVTGGFEQGGETVPVRGQSGDFYPGEGGGSSVLVWAEPETGLLFAIQGNLDKASLLKVAESLEPVSEFTNIS